MNPRERRFHFLRRLDLAPWRLRHPDDTALPGGDVVDLPGASGRGGRLAALEREVAACTRCALHRRRTRTVFGVGPLSPDWLLVGEAPGAEEDRRGEPFVGRAGKLLDNMLLAVGLSRGQVYIANVLKCRPPENRDPRPEEEEACATYLRFQVEWLRPRLILGLGRVAATRLLGITTKVPLGRLRGRVHEAPEWGVPVVVTYHPAYLLRSPAAKGQVWEDLLLALKIAGRVM